MMVRLQKVIAASGVASRRAAETMIREGHVTVNGKVVRVLGTCIDPSKDHVKIDGRHVQPSEPEVFVLLHKPPGYVTTMDDPYGRPTIADLVAKVKVRIFPVGRLDYDTEGLLLLTNNGNVAQACVHPRYHVPKTYLVKVSGVCTEEEIQNLEDGIALDDGMTAPAVIRKSGKAKANSWLEITIHEGRKHQIKRMLEALGHRVMRIIRIRFGPLDLGDLPVGVSRFATDVEANALRAIVRNDQAPERPCAGPTVRLQRSRPDRDTGPPRVGQRVLRQRRIHAARAARLVRRPSPGTSVRRPHGPTCKGRGRIGILGRRAYGQRVLRQRRIHAARAARLVRRPSPGTSVRRPHGPTCKGRDQLGILGRRAYGQQILRQRRIHAARAARLVRLPAVPGGQGES